MHHLIFLFILLAGCATSTVKVSADSQSSWWQSAEKSIAELREDRCHTDLTDLEKKSLFPTSENANQESTLEKIYSLRMLLNQKISSWSLKNPLSSECELKSYSIQKQMESREEQIAVSLYRKTAVLGQKVFTNSQFQLRSNPWMGPSTRVTSLSDLKNGDVVVQIGSDHQERYSLIFKQPDGKFYSLEQQLNFSWIRYEIDHPLSWLKRDLSKVIVLRLVSANDADELVEAVSRKNNLRFPSSEGTPTIVFPQSPLMQSRFLRVMEWKNYASFKTH